MFRKLTRLMFCVLALAAVTYIGRGTTLHAFEGDCYCSFSGGGGVFLYEDNGQFVDQITGTTLTTITTSPGSYYCADYCYNFGRAMGSYLCSFYGSGHKYNMVGYFNYDDFGNLYGGSGSGWYDYSALYEC